MFWCLSDPLASDGHSMRGHILHLQAAVYHRDLKLENALIHISAGSAPYLKICDFGFSKV